jgi:DNA-directed RNA polymerase subunit M/transcription elongation factor TFIIS
MLLSTNFQKLQNKLKFTIPCYIYKDKNYTIERRLILLLIADILEKNILFKEKNRNHQIDIIINIESSCFNETVKKSNELLIYQSWDNFKFVYLYQLYCSKVTKNLDSDSEVKSTYLINKIINNELNIMNIANMTSEELCPEKSVSIKNNINLRNNQQLKIKTSTLYKCRNCGHKQVSIREFQARSLDEGTNLSLTCTFCNYNWIVG